MNTMNTIEPCRLVMRPLCCFYCGTTSPDNLKETRIERLFGLRHCVDHSADASRDCNAYMHKRKIVRMADVRLYPALNAFVTLLETSPFLVRRTSGAAEAGWKPNFGTYMKSEFITCLCGIWSIPLIKDENAMKSVPLSDFADPELADPAVFAEPLLVLIKALDDGVYTEDARKAALLPVVKEFTEVPSITAYTVEGTSCRVFDC